MKEKLEKYRAHLERIDALEYALFLIEWDRETETPRDGIKVQTARSEILLNELYNLENDAEFLDNTKYLYENTTDQLLRRELELKIRKQRMIEKVPKSEYLAYGVLLMNACQVWKNAKETSEFAIFQPFLEEIVEYNKRFMKYLETDSLKGYDVLLDMYEESMGVNEYDSLFSLLQSELVPIIKSKRKAKINKVFKKPYNIEKQKEISQYLLDAIGFDKNKGVLKESVHPFTTSDSPSDVRITTHYYENNFISNIFSVLHEGGHAIYEQQIDDEFNGKTLGSAISMGIHESQSRLYENLIGRSKVFWECHFPKLQEILKELKKVTVDEFYEYINKSERSLIRIEADELTYPIHIVIRYELEKALLSGKLKVKDLPKCWNKLYKKYLGVTPPNDSLGVLQDVHWSGGSFGYFPTYALGSAYGVQILEAMKKDFNVDECIRNNQISKINEWLKEHIHKFGSCLTPKELIKNATGEDFNPTYYVNYLKAKFKE